MQYPVHLQKLIQMLKKLPGVGSKSAERFAFELLGWTTGELGDFSALIGELKEKIRSCRQCGCLMDGEIACSLCASDRRNRKLLCIIASPRDAFAIEQTREYQGLYHVLGGLLSPIDGRGPSHLNLPQLKERIIANQIEEIVIALDSTLEGDATSLYLKRDLAPLCSTISRLAFGLPMGSALEYVDGGTLARAFTGRRIF